MFKSEAELPSMGEYAISSSMKVSRSRGTFENSTGIDGLSAWMGKTSPKAKKSTKFQT